MTQYKNVDGVRSEMTQAEIDAHAITQNEIDKVVLQFSGNTKLLDLGLTQNETTAINNFSPEKGNQTLLGLGKTQLEATALTGYTPPLEV